MLHSQVTWRISSEKSVAVRRWSLLQLAPTKYFDLHSLDQELFFTQICTYWTIPKRLEIAGIYPQSALEGLWQFPECGILLLDLFTLVKKCNIASALPH